MTDAQRLAVRRSEVRTRLGELSGLDGDDFTDEARAELKSLTAEYADLELRHRAAILAEDPGETVPAPPDAEARERLELRSRASLTAFVLATMQGRLPSGAEAELQAAASLDDAGGDIPLELWDTRSTEDRAITPAPGTVGVNLDRILPAVFSPSIVSRLGVDMPRVKSGTYAAPRIITSTTAAALAKSAPAVATAATFNVQTTTVKRVSARLELAIEDIAAVGRADFESALRQNLSMVLSDALDLQMLTGDGQAPNLSGMFQALTDPTGAAPSEVADFDAFVSTFAEAVDGLWASTTSEVGLVVGPATYQLAAKTFRDATGQDLGDMTFADYARKFGAFWTNARMPDPDASNHVQQAILRRMGRSGMRTAVLPTWGRVSIDDIYSRSAHGERAVTFHVLLGDLLIVQPDAYAQVQFRTAA